MLLVGNARWLRPCKPHACSDDVSAIIVHLPLHPHPPTCSSSLWPDVSRVYITLFLSSSDVWPCGTTAATSHHPPAWQTEEYQHRWPPALSMCIIATSPPACHTACHTHCTMSHCICCCWQQCHCRPDNPGLTAGFGNPQINPCCMHAATVLHPSCLLFTFIDQARSCSWALRSDGMVQLMLGWLYAHSSWGVTSGAQGLVSCVRGSAMLRGVCTT
jgi:hypothetical protein